MEKMTLEIMPQYNVVCPAGAVQDDIETKVQRVTNLLRMQILILQEAGLFPGLEKMKMTRIFGVMGDPRVQTISRNTERRSTNLLSKLYPRNHHSSDEVQTEKVWSRNDRDLSLR